MPLPAALLKKLAKRGIVNADKVVQKKQVEEIIAEDYDNTNPDAYNHPTAKNENIWLEKLKRRFTQTKDEESVKGCPNKYNIHHVCSLFCLEKYGEGNDNVPLRIIRRFRRLLIRYPLQKDWVHIWDAGCGAYYFWNKLDDTVSWLPPKHPKAVISKSAATLRRESDRPDFTETPDDDDSATAASHQPSMMPSQSSNSPPHIMDEIPERYIKPAPVYKKTKSRDIEKILRTKKGRRQYHESSEKLDPMDPAAYSDCARGKWSSGLNPEERNAADTTASGALFQSRPYPSPGEVLRVNKGGAGKRHHTDDEDNKSDSEQHKQPKFQATIEDAEGNSSDDYNSD